MAKEKSKKITLEEVLVPIEEHPYVIPENWCWVRPLSVLEIEYGKGLSTKELVGDGYPVFGANGQIGYYSEYMFKEEMALMSCRGAYSGTMNCSLPYSYVTSNSLIMKDIDGVFTSSKFIYYMYSALNTEKLVSGSAQPQVTVQAFKDFAIPLPPLAEQKRIVEQIENLFAKLDEAKEKALSVVESFELREKAIYKKAFEGDLTNSWRAENGIDISEWEEIPFEKLGKLERGRSKHRPRNDKRLFGGKYPFIQTGDVAGVGMYVTSHKQTLSEFGFEQSRMFPKGTLCITIAANIGDAAILSYDCCFPDSVVGFTPGEKCLNKYMYFYLQEIKAELEYIAPATAQKNLNLKLLGKVEIKVPSLKEQEKIVEILEKQINDQENIVEKAENVIETIDVMKKSILAKAFRGELGTNIETEESAIELLKSIF